MITSTEDAKQSDISIGKLELSRPIVILTYARSGLAPLASALECDTRILPLRGVDAVGICATLTSSWRSLAGGAKELPDVAGDAIKSVIQAMVCTLQPASAIRWASYSVGTAEVADSFATLYPAAKFLCLHRSCADTVYSALAACRWGLTGYGFDRFAASHPGNSVAALTDYWVTHTERLVQFEQAHLGQCHRILYEDLRAKQSAVLEGIYACLDFKTRKPSWNTPDLAVPVDGSSPAGRSSEGSSRPAILDWSFVPLSVPTAWEVGGGVQVPRTLIPKHLAARANELLEFLGYPTLGATLRQ